MTVASDIAAGNGISVNTSMQGAPIALILGGSNRLAGNLIDYSGFNYQNAPQSGRGKGGVASIGKGRSGNYDYFASFVIGVRGVAGI
jgi:hypothetical protein